MIDISVIIPVYNRPEEIKELLESLSKQTKKNFEVIVVEDGSVMKCKEIVDLFSKKLNIRYIIQDNTGPAGARNKGASEAKGNYFVFFDSDCLIPEHYFTIVFENLYSSYIDAYGGPDRADASFSPLQKAINYSMTSFFTTGGIRGGGKKLDKFHPRSFNMGISREVFDKINGFSNMRFGEDIDLSLRIIKSGFKTTLLEDAFVYHKRRTSFRQFYKQVYNSGIARINLFKRHPASLKVVHFFPSAFVISVFLLFILSIFELLFLVPLLFFIFVIFMDAALKNSNMKVGLLSVISSIIQLTGYGLGFLKSFWIRIILGKDEFHAFKKNFYS